MNVLCHAGTNYGMPLSLLLLLILSWDHMSVYVSPSSFPHHTLKCHLHFVYHSVCVARHHYAIIWVNPDKSIFKENLKNQM